MRSPFFIPFLASIAIHLGLLSAVAPSREAAVSFKSGASAVALHILPSVARQAAKSQPPHDPAPERTRPYVVPEPEIRDATRPVALPPERRTAPDRLETPPRPTDREPARPTYSDILPRTDTAVRPEARVERPVVPSEQVAAQRPTATPVLCAAIAQPVVEHQAPRQQPDDSEGSDAVSSTQADGDVGEKGAITAPTLVGSCKPRYPRYSRIHGEEGTVVLSVEIRASGQPGTIHVVRSSGYRRLDRAAVEALENATFTPAVAAGRPVASTKQIAFTFRLRDPGN